MPRELKVIEYCDVCIKDEGAKVDSVYTDTITMGGVTRDLMLCGPHRDKLIGELPEQLALYGVRPDSSAAPITRVPGDVPPCPICSRELTTKGSLRVHMDNLHNARINDFFPGYYQPRDTRPREMREANPQGGRACPYCERIIGGTNGALHVHIKSKHAESYPAFLMDHPLTAKAAHDSEMRAARRAAH